MAITVTDVDESGAPLSDAGMTRRRDNGGRSTVQPAPTAALAWWLRLSQRLDSILRIRVGAHSAGRKRLYFEALSFSLLGEAVALTSKVTEAEETPGQHPCYW